jgi:AcrR family transcriptional regulator
MAPTRTAPAVIAVGKTRRRSQSKKRRGGRPSRADALELNERILAAATELFLTEGYGSTSIEAVAAAAGISKRTFYHRFNDKPALFAAVVHRIIGQIRPPADVPLLVGTTLQEIMHRLTGLLLQAALSPQAAALHRLVTAESVRFPNLARAVYGDWVQQATTLIHDVLARELQGARSAEDLLIFAAEQFLHMIVTLPQRRIMGLDVPVTANEIDSWAGRSVNLFLNGCRGRRGA